MKKILILNFFIVYLFLITVSNLFCANVTFYVMDPKNFTFHNDVTGHDITVYSYDMLLLNWYGAPEGGYVGPGLNNMSSSDSLPNVKTRPGDTLSVDNNSIYNISFTNLKSVSQIFNESKGYQFKKFQFPAGSNYKIYFIYATGEKNSSYRCFLQYQNLNGTTQLYEMQLDN